LARQSLRREEQSRQKKSGYDRVGLDKRRNLEIWSLESGVWGRGKVLEDPSEKCLAVSIIVRPRQTFGIV